jgi:hypothetical protein
MMFICSLASKVKVKVNLSLCLTKHQNMKAYWGVDVYFQKFLTSAIDGGDWSALRPGRFTPREKAPRTHWLEGWLGQSRSVPGGEKIIPSPRRESNPRNPIVHSVVQRYTIELSRLYFSLNDLEQLNILINLYIYTL